MTDSRAHIPFGGATNRKKPQPDSRISGRIEKYKQLIAEGKRPPRSGFALEYLKKRYIERCMRRFFRNLRCDLRREKIDRYWQRRPRAPEQKEACG